MNDTLPRISVIGLGKLGSPMVGCFGSKGFQVIGVDTDEQKVAAVADLRPPVFEPHLEERLRAGAGRITATTDTRAAVRETDVTMLIVPTPSQEDGTFSLRHALPACEAIGEALREKSGYHLVVITSTVMPGSTGGQLREALEQASGKRVGTDFGLCYSPEFIALGSVVHDFLNPDFLLIGESDERAGDLLESIYRNVCDVDAPVARMNFVNAEIAKISVNTFVTTKIAFANMIARICERIETADADVVTTALGLDSRIGARYLRGSISYGGPCFPRDNIALAAMARQIGAPALIAEATDRFNREDVDRLVEIVRGHLDGEGTVAVLGLSYKPNTDVVEESAALALTRRLAEEDIPVVAYDPAANEAASRQLDGSGVRFASSVEEAVADADVVVVATPWEEFRQLDTDMLARPGRQRVVIDCWRFLDRTALSVAIEYVALGEGAKQHEPSSTVG